MNIKLEHKNLVSGLILIVQMCFMAPVSGQGIDSIFLKDFEPRNFVQPLFDSSFVQSSAYPTSIITANKIELELGKLIHKKTIEYLDLIGRQSGKN